MFYCCLLLLKKELNKQEIDLKGLKKKYAIGEIDKAIYEEVKNEINAKISQILKNMGNGLEKVSNLNKYISLSQDVAANLTKYWCYNDLATKKRIQETVFPEGIIIDLEKRQYLTKKVNSFFSAIPTLSSILENKKSGLSDNFSEKSAVVAGTGLEPMTFGL